MNEPDKYDNAIGFLAKHPTWIQDGWRNGSSSNFLGCLFAYATPNGHVENDAGCLTQIRDHLGVACGQNFEFDESLTEKIRGDERIPTSEKDITTSDLGVFAEWQRKLDTIYPERADIEIDPSTIPEFYDHDLPRDFD